MRNLLLITGAGASYDVVDWRKASVDFRYWPPLTKNLFKSHFINIKYENKLKDVEMSSYIRELLFNHPVVNELGTEFQMEYAGRDDEAALEKFLLERKNNENVSLSRDFWAMPYYLEDLFLGVSNKCIKSIRARATNYKFLLNKLINKNVYTRIVWLNLNYDLFADVAIKSFHNNEDFKTFDDYMDIEIKEGLKISYTKPHGSVDWWYVSEEANFIKDDIKDGRIPERFEESIFSSELMLQRQITGGMDNKKYPAITAPMGDYKFICESHVEKIMPILKEIKDMLCIGFSALDEDILDLIEKNCPTFEKIQIVNGTVESGRKAYDNMAKHCRKTGIINGVSELKAVYNGGFSNFVRKGFDDWI